MTNVCNLYISKQIDVSKFTNLYKKNRLKRLRFFVSFISSLNFGSSLIFDYICICYDT